MTRLVEDPTRVMPIRTTGAQGLRVPALGFGTSRLRGESCRRLVEDALRLGYRLIDTAASYDNEEAVGLAVASSGIARADILLCTKVRAHDLVRGTPTEALARSLDRLQTSYADLFLLHWPCPDADIERVLERLEAARVAGLARAIGLANAPAAFLAAARRRLPHLAVDQIERHLLLQQPKLTACLRAAGVLLMAYRPTAFGAAAAHQQVQAIAAAFGRTAHQVALRWHLEQSGTAAVAGASTPAQVRENLEILAFALGPAEMAALATIDEGRRTLHRPYAPDWPEDRMHFEPRYDQRPNEPSAIPME